MNNPYGRPTTVGSQVAAHTRVILRLRDLDRAEQKQREGWCRVCAADVDGMHAMCWTCRKERRA